MQNDEGLELRWIMDMLRRWYWLILGCALLAAVIAFIVASLTPPSYEATTTLLVGQAQDTQSNDYNTLIAGEQLAQTYSQMLKGQSIMQAVISQLSLAETPDTLAKNVTVTPVSGTQLIRLTVKSSSPAQAALLANTITDAFIAQIQTLRSGRYSDSLTSIQEKIKSLSDQINETQSALDALNVKKVQEEQDLSQLENTLSGNRSQSQTLQQGLQSLQLTLVQLKNNVDVVETAQLMDYIGYGPYTAVATLLVNKTSLGGGNNDLTYRQMLVGRSVIDAAIAKLGLSESADAIAGRIDVASVQNTQLLRLSVQDTDGTRAKLLANAIADAFITQVQQLIEEPYNDQLTSIQKQLDDLGITTNKNVADINRLTAEQIQTETDLSRLDASLAEFRSDYRSQQQDYEQLRLTAANVADTVVVSEKAQAPEKPASSRFLYTLLAGVVGLMIGLGASYVLAQMDDKVRSSQDISARLGLNLLGSIVQNDKDEDELVMASRPGSFIGESFRVLSTNIRLSTINNPLKFLVVTSPAASEGKSIVAANLAIAFAKAGQKVVIVDADLRFPRIHQLFGLDKDVGLTGSLLKDTTYGCLQNSPVDQLKILTSGEIPPNPAELLGSAKFKKLLDELKEKADLLVIDSPPVLPVADAAILAAIGDGVLLVVRAEQTPTRAVRDAVESLNKVGAHLVGVVLNDVPEHRDGYYGYYGYQSEKSDGRHALRPKPLHRIARFFAPLSAKPQPKNPNGHKTKVREIEGK